MSAIFSVRHGARIVAMMCAVYAGVPSIGAKAAPLLEQSASVTGPFGLATQALGEGPLTAKWRTVESAINDELKVIADCRSDRPHCASPQALQFLKIVDDVSAQTGLARIGEINRAINLAIRPLSDEAQFGVEDVWTSPLATLAAAAGDCEDYAIAKYVALREAGVSSDDVQMVILRNALNGEDHAVAVARVDGRWRILDNRHFLMIEDMDLTKLQPVFSFDASGAKRFDPTPAAVATLNVERNVAQQIVPADATETGISPSAIDPSVAAVASVEFWQIRAM